jgi:hypothetical protein
MADIEVHAKKVLPANKGLFYVGVVTLAAVGLAFAAFNDITTDNATSFTTEYIFLLGCGAWVLGAAVFLIIKSHRALGILSLLALACGVWGQQAIGPGIVPSFQPEYVATLGSVVWFLGLSVILMILGIRGHRAGRPVTA